MSAPAEGATGDVELEGVVEAQLPSALYRVRLADAGPGSRPRGREGGRDGGRQDGEQRAGAGAAHGHGTVTAHLSADPRRNFVRILVGERVRVRLSPRDLTRGAIVARLGPG
jgi:translation initiation factor IF-1